MEPLWSVVLIARNEAKTLPSLLKSLGEFMGLGGEVVVCDTGSTDETAGIARGMGCKVEEVGTRFVTVIDAKMAKAINKRFIPHDEEPVVKAGDRLFDYAAARNYAASLARNNVCSMPDCDEVFTRLDIEKINAAIQAGASHLEYEFIFSHDANGKPAIQFRHSKFYDRSRMRWVGVVHEVLAGGGCPQYLDDSTIRLEHYQNPETNRNGYLTGLALDCFQKPDNDRNSHYFGRELLWKNRPKSAIRELKRHVAMNRWPAERAQSLIFIGDAWGVLKNPAEQVSAYSLAYSIEPGRREALLRLAEFYRFHDKPKVCAAYAAAALEIPYEPFYANHMSHYREAPHEFLYWAKGWLGDIAAARVHIAKALEYAPNKPECVRDLEFYFSKEEVALMKPAQRAVA